MPLANVAGRAAPGQVLAGLAAGLGEMRNNLVPPQPGGSGT
jgi:hypothetical protein